MKLSLPPNELADGTGAINSLEILQLNEKLWERPIDPGFELRGKGLIIPPTDSLIAFP